LYLADRRALLDSGRPITFDWYVSMPHGPVLSFTLDLINGDPDPEDPSYWHSYISERKDQEVSLIEEAPNDQLSHAEEAVLDRIFEELGSRTPWELRDFSHTLPEWQDPQGSSLPIGIEDILRAAGIAEDEIQEVIESLEAEAAADRILE
ncbi:MAG: Panacea domain-containing protein, partial [Terriglobia bacterium]